MWNFKIAVKFTLLKPTTQRNIANHQEMKENLSVVAFTRAL